MKQKTEWEDITKTPYHNHMIGLQNGLMFLGSDADFRWMNSYRKACGERLLRFMKLRGGKIIGDPD